MGVCYLIGHPVGHSMSAVMHNAAFRELDLDLRYELRPVRPGELGAFASTRLREREVRGANVTIPHKVSVIEHLDKIDQTASRIGAVNTIVNKEGLLKGYNTDGIGAMRALGEAYGCLEGSRAILIGAGGAARAIGYNLATSVEELAILNRTPERTDDLAGGLSDLPECTAVISAHPLLRRRLEKLLEDADILINATPLGMGPNADETPVDRDLLRPGLLVFDSVYNPPRTRLLREAEEAGARTLSGMSMLVYQGAASFELWTGREAPEGLMARAVEEELGSGQP
jgi:shikimate dehydrogenase